MKQVIKIPSLGDAENTEVIEICVNPGDSVIQKIRLLFLNPKKLQWMFPLLKMELLKKSL